MSASAEFRCRCGEVRGVVTDASPRTANRVVCYCGDCQAFVHKLGRADLLDAHGGSDIVQVAPASLAFVQGQHRIKGLRLTSKGLYRWYASCCNTPVGNTLTPAIPFVGIVVTAFDQGAQRADVFGPPTGRENMPWGNRRRGQRGSNCRCSCARWARFFSWRFGGKAWPHPFFARDRDAPIYPVDVLSHDEREALRAYCGPHPTAYT